MMPPALDLEAWRLVLAVGTFLAAVHAYRKLSPYFAITWFGAALVFAYLSSGGPAEPERVLLPGLVFYLSAAVTKGLVETRNGVRGNHVVHVIMTGLFGGLLALPIEAAARVERWPMPMASRGPLWGVGDALGGVPLDVVVAWCLAATLFYGTYKVLDHIGLGKPLQTVLLFASMPLLAIGLERLRAMI